MSNENNSFGARQHSKRKGRDLQMQAKHIEDALVTFREGNKVQV